MAKYNISSAEFEKLSDDLKGIYVQTKDGYELNVEGAVPKTKVDEFRQNNIELMDFKKKYEGVDLEKYNEMKKTQQALEDKKLIESGDVDKLISNKIAAITSDFTAKIENLSSENQTLKQTINSSQAKMLINDVSHSAFDKFKIRSDARDAVMAQVNQRFKVVDGNAVAYDGEKILTGKNGNLTIDEFVESQPDFMKEPSKGGAGSGGGQPSGHPLTSVQKIANGLKKGL